MATKRCTFTGCVTIVQAGRFCYRHRPDVLNAPCCIVEGCDQPARSPPYCYRHRKRLELGLALDDESGDDPDATSWERLHNAALDLADADVSDESAYELACARLRAMAAAFSSGRKPRRSRPAAARRQ